MGYRQFVGLAAAALLAAHGSAAFAAGDAVKGKAVFARCAICHAVNNQNRIGPHLNGVIGRKAGSVAGFNYSPAMKAHGAKTTWNPQTLDVYLTAPQKVVKGTKMAFAGLANPADRANVIAYLATQK
jgi:cytochrome c